MAETIFPPKDHNHAACVTDMLARAEEICTARHARLTPLRRRIFKIIASSHEALGAYDILDVMAKGGARPAPVTVYRALDFLIAHGLVHKIATGNAFIACSMAHAGGQSLLLICSDCGTVGEISAAPLVRAVAGAARPLGFSVEREVHEVSGLCRHCAVR